MTNTHTTCPRAWRLFLLAVALCACLLALLVEPSLAASDVGRNVGKEVDAWAKAILLGVVALVALPAIARRDLGQGVVIALLAVLVGGFVFAPGAVKDMIAGLWKAIGG
jgi:hypothetical protein